MGSIEYRLESIGILSEYIDIHLDRRDNRFSKLICIGIGCTIIIRGGDIGRIDDGIVSRIGSVIVGGGVSNMMRIDIVEDIVCNVVIVIDGIIDVWE